MAHRCALNATLTRPRPVEWISVHTFVTWLLVLGLPTLGMLLGWQARTLLYSTFRPSHRRASSAPRHLRSRPQPQAGEEDDAHLEEIIEKHFGSEDF